jgi:hypothetical protein
MGDTPDAFEIYDTILEAYGLSLQDHYYYYLSAISIGEKDESILRYGLDATLAPNLTERDHYYAGLLWYAAGNDLSAAQHFGKISNRTLCTLASCLLTERVKDWTETKRLYTIIDGLTKDPIYLALFTKKIGLSITALPVTIDTIQTNLATPLYYFEMGAVIAGYQQYAFPHLINAHPSFYEILSMDDFVRESLDLHQQRTGMQLLFTSFADDFEALANQYTPEDFVLMIEKTNLKDLKAKLVSKMQINKQQLPQKWQERFETDIAIELQGKAYSLKDWTVVLSDFFRDGHLSNEQGVLLLLYAIKINSMGNEDDFFTDHLLDKLQMAGSFADEVLPPVVMKIFKALSSKAFINLFRSRDKIDDDRSVIAKAEGQILDYQTFKKNYLMYLTLLQRRLEKRLAQRHFKPRLPED